MFGVTLKVIYLETSFYSYPNYCEQKIPEICPQNKQQIFASFYSSGSNQYSHQQLPLVPGTGWKGSSFSFTTTVRVRAWYRQRGRRAVAEKVYSSSVSAACRSCAVVAACVHCGNSLLSLPSGQGWVMQPTKPSVSQSHSSVIMYLTCLTILQSFYFI